MGKKRKRSGRRRGHVLLSRIKKRKARYRPVVTVEDKKKAGESNESG